MLASRGLFFLRPTDPKTAADPKKVAELAKRIGHSPAVSYAEPDTATSLVDTRYHAWPEGDPDPVAGDESEWLDQTTGRLLGLSVAHRFATGSDVIVAVLDTGIDASHPVLAGHLSAGFDYVDDDADPAEVASGLDGNGDGIPDGAYGHGTFVAGMVHLVAPDATVMPMRVLDPDGDGSIFLVAQAIVDSVEAGADVINLSMGTKQKINSKVVGDAVKYAQDRGAVVVAAAGNDGTELRQYPGSGQGRAECQFHRRNRSALAVRLPGRLGGCRGPGRPSARSAAGGNLWVVGRHLDGCADGRRTNRPDPLGGSLDLGPRPVRCRGQERPQDEGEAAFRRDRRRREPRTGHQRKGEMIIARFRALLEGGDPSTTSDPEL